MKHGMSNTKYYKSWHNMIARCYNKTHISYHNYGGRGITVCEEWRNDFMSYYNHIRTLPGFDVDGLSVDRIDNNGNYEEGNLRWTNKRIQTINQRHTKNTSGFVGVHFIKAKGKWCASVGVKRKLKNISCHSTALQAAEARDWYIIKHGLWEYSLQVVRKAM